MNIDAALLIGDKRKSRPICGENKNFLDLKGMPLFFHVLQSLDSAQGIEIIAIVGDAYRIQAILEKHHTQLKHPEKILVVEQGANLYDNALKAFQALSEAGQTAAERNDVSTSVQEKAVLYLAGDTPLITPQEIDEFIVKCDLNRFDYFLGVSTEERLRPFYPRRKEKGIKLAYFYVKENKLRINNLHVVKPFKIQNRRDIQKMYDYRYQKELFNFLKLLWAFYRLNLRSRGIYYYLVLHVNLLLARIGLERFTSLFRRLVDIPGVEKVVSDVLGCSFKIIETSVVGGALDIDNERHYEAITAMFDRWREYQVRLLHGHATPLEETMNES